MSMTQNGAVISVGYKRNFGPITVRAFKTFSNMLARILEYFQKQFEKNNATA